MAKRGRPRGSKNKKKKTLSFKASNNAFWFKVVRGVRNFLQSPFK